MAGAGGIQLPFTELDQGDSFFRVLQLHAHNSHSPNWVSDLDSFFKLPFDCNTKSFARISSFLLPHRLLSLPGCYSPAYSSPACDWELRQNIAFHPACSPCRSLAHYGISITEQKVENTPLLSLMCLIGIHPNSYSFSRKALPGFLACCVRDLVLLGSVVPTVTCWRHQEPLTMGTCGYFCGAGHQAARWLCLGHKNCLLFLPDSSVGPSFVSGTRILM